MKINGIIVAAGLSSRMGEFKPFLETCKGKTVIEQSVDSMIMAGVEQLILVLGYRGDEIKEHILSRYSKAKVRLTFSFNPAFAESDMLTSVKIGIQNLMPCDAFFLLPGDMPAIHSSTFQSLRKLMEENDYLVTFPTIGGHRKHPPLISWRCRDTVLEFTGDGGLREIWRYLDKEIGTVAVEDAGCNLDTDTRTDYEKLLEHLRIEKINNNIGGTYGNRYKIGKEERP